MMKERMRKFRTSRLAASLFCILAWLALSLVASAVASEKKMHGQTDGLHPRPRSTVFQKLPPDVREDYQKFCFNISDAARDARYARQKQQLKDMERKLRELLNKLEKKRAEYESWVLRRKEITDRMTRSMLNVYAKMEPEAAAAQISHMEYAVAVAILSGLGAQKASAILNEMDPRKAGMLVNAIVGAVAGKAAVKETN